MKKVIFRILLFTLLVIAVIGVTIMYNPALMKLASIGVHDYKKAKAIVFSQLQNIDQGACEDGYDRDFLASECMPEPKCSGVVTLELGELSINVQRQGAAIYLDRSVYSKVDQIMLDKPNRYYKCDMSTVDYVSRYEAYEPIEPFTQITLEFTPQKSYRPDYNLFSEEWLNRIKEIEYWTKDSDVKKVKKAYKTKITDLEHGIRRVETHDRIVFAMPLKNDDVVNYDCKKKGHATSYTAKCRSSFRSKENIEISYSFDLTNNLSPNLASIHRKFMNWLDEVRLK